MSHEALESLRGSRNRDLVLGKLVKHGAMRLEHLSDEASLATNVVLFTLHGKLPGYSPELALVTLGLVRVTHDSLGPIYEATETGEVAWKKLLPAMRKG